MFSQYQCLTNLPSIKTQCSSNPNLRPTFTQLKPNVLPILILCLQADHCMTLTLPQNTFCFREMPLLQSQSTILYRMSWPIYTAISKSQCSRLRKCCRQVEAEVISNSWNKIHQTWCTNFSKDLYRDRPKCVAVC